MGHGVRGTVGGRAAGRGKVIRGELAADPEFRVRFGREVAAARSVSGLFTAPVVDADADGPVPWLATAYVAGPSLADAVREHGPWPRENQDQRTSMKLIRCRMPAVRLRGPSSRVEC
jgi:hypothetical protein